MRVKHLQPQRRCKVIIVGCGLIGSHTAQLVAALPKISEIALIDRDRYEPGNLATQAILPCDIGESKAEALAKRLGQQMPKQRIYAIHADVENVPLGELRGDVLLGCLDSKRARCIVNEAAWRLGLPWIDAGVGEGRYVRVAVFFPGLKNCCYECQMDEEDYAAEQTHPCQSAVEAPATNSPAYLGALAASLQVAECAKLLSGSNMPLLTGRELLLDCETHRLFITRIPRRNSCRFDHLSFPIRQLQEDTAGTTLAGAFELGRRLMGSKAELALKAPGKLFVRRLTCVCGHSRPVCA